jgi:hypothetical protein
VTEQGLSRIRTNQDPKELYKSPLLVVEINGASLNWLGLLSNILKVIQKVEGKRESAD